MADATADALQQVLDRLDRLEAKVDRLGMGAPPQVSQKLDEPEVASALARIVDRMEAIESAVGTLTHVTERLPHVVDMMSETAGKLYNQLEDQGVDVFDRAEASLPVAERATRPETLAVLGRLMDRLDSVDFAAGAADTTYRKLRDAGTDLDALVDKGSDAAVRLAALTRAPEFEALLSALEAADVMGKASTALVDARKAPREELGMFGVLRALGEPDVKRATGFAIRVARRFGALLAEK